LAEPSRLLILVRHGDSTHDDEPELTDLGREQTRITADRLAALPGRPDRLVHSPLPRAAQTAAIIADVLGLPPTADDLLAECIPSIPPADRLTPQQQAAFATFTEEEVATGAQQAAAARDRYLAQPDSDGIDLVVSHGNLIRWLVTAAVDSPGHSWFQLADYNCALSVLSLRTARPPALLAYNDAGHLPAHLRGTEYPRELRW
jgi:serine/threonine-protein phosphatase PGAM5